MSGRLGLVVCLLILFATALTAQRPSAPQNERRERPAPRFDAWRVLGPGGGGTMIGPTISPHDPSGVEKQWH